MICLLCFGYFGVFSFWVFWIFGYFGVWVFGHLVDFAVALRWFEYFGFVSGDYLV